MEQYDPVNNSVSFNSYDERVSSNLSSFCGHKNRAPNRFVHCSLIWKEKGALVQKFPVRLWILGFIYQNEEAGEEQPRKQGYFQLYKVFGGHLQSSVSHDKQPIAHYTSTKYYPEHWILTGREGISLLLLLWLLYYYIANRYCGGTASMITESVIPQSAIRKENSSLQTVCRCSRLHSLKIHCQIQSGTKCKFAKVFQSCCGFLFVFWFQYRHILKWIIFPLCISHKQCSTVPMHNNLKH